MEEKKEAQQKTISIEPKRPLHRADIGIGTFVAIALLFFVAAAFFLTPSPNHLTGFATINEVKADAATKDEAAAPDNTDQRKPIWTTCLKKTTPSFFQRKIENILHFVGAKKSPSWSASYFKNLIEKTVAAREAKGYKQDYVLRLVPTPKTRFIVHGDLIGHYHSLARRLEKLVTLNILDENLKLISPDDYMVFMGDVLNHSPFILETLTLVLTLMDRNPGKVLYLRGSDEWKGYWHKYGLQTEFAFKAAHIASRESLKTLVDDLCQTLPLGVYISVHPHATNDFVRFSHYAIATPATEKYQERIDMLDDRFYSKALLENRKINEEKIVPLQKWGGDVDVDQVTVLAIVKSIKKLKEYVVEGDKPGKGLTLLVPEQLATAWSVAASPVVITQRTLSYYNESFVIIDSKPSIEDWTIELFYRDVRKKDDFKTETFNFISGKKQGEDKRKVRIRR